MDISGTLHFYSGADKELFFVFDDDVAQDLYRLPDFDIDDLETRRAYISVGPDRFIHRRTLSFSRKQTEIKISLCSRTTKDGRGALTSLYDWFRARGRPRPAPFELLGKLLRTRHGGERGWELRLTEPAGLVTPPGLPRRKKATTRVRRSFINRRQFIERDLRDIGPAAEKLALTMAARDFPVPKHGCLWRHPFLDSERIEIREIGIIADIDIWNSVSDSPEMFIEVKAQKVRRVGASPMFFLSDGEWRSYQSAKKLRVPYAVWLFQYRALDDFRNAPDKIVLTIFDDLNSYQREPTGYVVTPPSGTGTQYSITATGKKRRA